MKIAFTGDLFLGGDLAARSAEGVLRTRAFDGTAAIVVNLEQPLSDGLAIADKSTLFTGSAAATKLVDWGITAVGLANNHIHDKTDAGITETLRHLDDLGIRHFGAGADLAAAQLPLRLTNDLYALAYCDFGRPYLKQVRVATETEPGVAPLRHEQITADLARLPAGARAVLFLHWGREHVWLPPAADLDLARRLLEDDRVVGIIGMHAHRIQGIVEHQGKRAYMCLGNFLFPNFYIAPPTQLCYPDPLPVNVWVTRQYHEVKVLTYKKWRAVNRASLVVILDAASGRLDHTVVCQDDDQPIVVDAPARTERIERARLRLLSMLYRLPRPLYAMLERASTQATTLAWKAGIVRFRVRQEGIGWVGQTIGRKLARRRAPALQSSPEDRS